MPRMQARARDVRIVGPKEQGESMCARRANVSGICLASEMNFEVNDVLANTDLIQTHCIFIDVAIMNTVLWI